MEFIFGTKLRDATILLKLLVDKTAIDGGYFFCQDMCCWIISV